MLENLPPPPRTDSDWNGLTSDLVTTIEFFSEQDGVLGGADQVMAYLRALALPTLQVSMREAGSALQRGDLVLRIRGKYSEFGLHASALSGILSAASGWAAAARRLADAAQPEPVIFHGASNVHPALASYPETVAVQNGCLGSTCEWARGLASRQGILLSGDTVRYLKNLDAALPPELPRLTYVDLFHDEADEAGRAALALGDRLTGIVLMAHNADPRQVSDLIRRVREQLELAGFPRLKLFLDGNFSAADIEWFKLNQVLLDGYFVGDQIGAAPPHAFSYELCESNEKPLGRRGRTPGTTPGPGLQRYNLDE